MIYNVNQNKNKMMARAVEISGTNQPGNGRGVSRIKTGNQTGDSPISANLRKMYRKNAENSRKNRHCKFLDNFSNRT